MTITIGQMQGAIAQFWGAAIAKNLYAISLLVSTDLKATYQVTINGVKAPVKNLDFEQYIAELKQMFGAFQLALSTTVNYDPTKFKLSNGEATWTVDYMQNLQIEAGTMTSTGTQTWTFNGVQFVALSVIENDKTPQSKSALV